MIIIIMNMYCQGKIFVHGHLFNWNYNKTTFYAVKLSYYIKMKKKRENIIQIQFIKFEHKISILADFLFHRFLSNLQVIMVGQHSLIMFFFYWIRSHYFFIGSSIIFLFGSKGYNGEYIQNNDVLLTPKFECVRCMTISSTFWSNPM